MSSRDLTIFMIWFISSLEIISVVKPDPNVFSWIAVSAADAAAVNALVNGLSMFLIINNPAFSNGPKSLPKNPHDCPILCNWGLDNFILADEPFEDLYKFFWLVFLLIIIIYVENYFLH